MTQSNRTAAGRDRPRAGESAAGAAEPSREDAARAPDPRERFAFGRNWRAFSTRIDPARIAASEAALRRLLAMDDLTGRRFLDIGCGSGLSSLAAVRLGATVHGFDFDPESVATARRLRDAHGYGDDTWTLEQGSVLDGDFMAALGTFDVVYSWGVLHHTGALWAAIDLASRAVGPTGRLALAVYNDQGGASARWLAVKRLYVRSPAPVRLALVAAVGAFFELRAGAVRLVRLQNPLPFADWRRLREERGMSIWHDLVDWVGGYPFEVAKPEEVLRAVSGHGLRLLDMTTCAGGPGCNEYLFVRA